MFSPTAKKDFSTDVKETYEETKDSLNQSAQKIGHEARELYDSASTELTQVSASMAKEIRSNPLRSSAIALGIGIVMGILLRR